MTFIGEEPLTYNQVNDRISALMAMLENLGIKSGDKVAIFSANMPNWGISYYAITFMGAIAIPMLPDFSVEEVNNIIGHSEAKAILVSEMLSSKLDDVQISTLKHRIGIEDFSIIESPNESVSFVPDSKPVKKYNVEEEDLAVIIYTSGTTGKSKGVMLTHKNISFTTIGCKIIQPVDETDRFLSILPLSHTYENTLGLMLPMLGGSCIYYMRKPPTPSILLPAMKKVQPTIMLTVPMIMEKIYRNRVLPTFTDSSIMRFFYNIPATRKALNKVAGKKLKKTFGGQLKFFGIGGAKLDKVVEQFLLEAKFPYAIGYGLTETSPLLAGINPQNSRLESTGPAMEGVELKINKPDKVTGEGEIWARGANVMKGYYKEPELTDDVLTKDGWFKTGDLGIFDKDNYLYIRGRIKNMIIGPSGENIYPEEIESVINNFGYVVESLVVEKKGRLVAMVHFNKDELIDKYKHLKEDVTHNVEEKIEDLRKELHIYVNKKVNKFSKIHNVVLQPVPFQKTATKKIKRFLYTV